MNINSILAICDHTLLLQSATWNEIKEVCDDAKNEGYLYVEAYPFLDEKYPYQFHGPAKMYKNRGFQLFDKKSWFLIMQKKL